VIRNNDEGSRDVHPLSRLIEFETGIAVGATVTDKLEDVSELIRRLFENRMAYHLGAAQTCLFSV
jgi:hypothetical protein